jgi:hypothetical protein
MEESNALLGTKGEPRVHQVDAWSASRAQHPLCGFSFEDNGNKIEK